MNILDLIDDIDDENDEKEFEQEVRNQIKLTIKVFEILNEELGKANLPVDTKQAIMGNLIKNFKENN